MLPYLPSSAAAFDDHVFVTPTDEHTPYQYILHPSLLCYLRQGGYVIVVVCLSVCLSVCKQLCLKTSERICMKFSGKVGNTDSDPDHDSGKTALAEVCTAPVLLVRDGFAACCVEHIT